MSSDKPNDYVMSGKDPKTGQTMWKIKKQLDRAPALDNFVQYAVSGPSSSLLSTGGQCTAKVTRNSAGLVKKQYIVVNFTVATGQVKMLPASMWISLLQNFGDGGTSPCQQIYDLTNQINHNTLTAEEFSQVADEILCKSNGWDTPYLQTGNYTAFIRVFGSLYENLYCRNIDTDMGVEINFNSTSCIDTIGTSVVTVTGVAVFLKLHDLNREAEEKFKQMFKRDVVSKNFISYNRYSSTSTITAGSANTFQLSTIRGYNGFLVFAIRASTSPTAGAIKKLLKLGDGVSIGTYQLLDAGGRSISKLNVDAQYALKYDTSDYWTGQLAKKWYYYTIAHGHPKDILQGIPSGYYFYSGTEVLQLNPATAISETSRVVSLIPTLASTGAATAATQGTVQITYSRGFDGPTYTSASIAYNANTAALNAAIVAMQLPDSLSVSTATGFNSTSGLIMTISSLSEADLAVNGAQWSVTGNSLSNGTLPLLITTSDTTPGITLKGFTTASCTLDVYGAVLRNFKVTGGYPSWSDWQPGM